jgi:hypothetical protein
MGSRFLFGGETSDVSTLNDGSADLYINSLRLGNLSRSMPVKTDNKNLLYSTKLLLSDILDSDTLLRLNIEITETDESFELPDPTSTPYRTIQYKKSTETAQDIVITFRGKQMAKLYSNLEQTVIFNKFNDTWIL